MCHMVWIAADQALPIIEWEDGRSLFVTLKTEYQDGLREKFSKPHIYYVGSYEKCGCGFYERHLEDDDERRAQSEGSLQALASYLADAAKSGPIELYTCWADDEPLPVEHRDEISAEAIAAPDFDFQDRQFLIITA